MGNFIGTMSGFLMFILICLIVYSFLISIGIIKQKNINDNLKKYLIGVVIFYVLQLIIYAMIRSFYNDSILSFDMNNIWNETSVFHKLFHNDYLYNLDFICHTGNFPIYYFMMQLLGALFFHAYNEISMYLSFLVGVLSFIILFSIINKQYQGKNKELLKNLSLFIPCGFLIFIPIPFSFSMMFLLLFYYCLITNKKNILKLVIAILSFLMHPMGLSAIIIWFVCLKTKKNNSKVALLIILLIQAILMIIGYLCQWSNWYEVVIATFIFGLLLVSKYKSIKNIEYIRIILIIINAFLLLGLMLQKF